MKGKQRRIERLGPWLPFPFGAWCLCFGLGLLTLASLRWRTFLRAQSWPAVSATVRDVELTGTKTYSVTATYEYEFNRRSYTGHHVDIMGGGDSNYALHRRRYEELKGYRDAGRPFPAFVNPKTPSESVLYRQADSWMYAVFLFGLGAAEVGAAAVWFGARAVRRRNRLKALSKGDRGRLWHIRPDWRQGRVKPSTARHLLPSCLVAIGVGTFISAFIPLMASAGAPWWCWLIAGFFVLVGVLALMSAVHALAAFVVYGTPVLCLSEVPVVPGRRVVAALRTARPLAADRWTLRLECSTNSSSEDSEDSGDGPRLAELLQRLKALLGKRPTGGDPTWYGECVYRQKLSAQGHPQPDHTGALMLPVALELPRGASETALDPGFTVTWALAAKRRAFPLSFSASFELPVFAVPEDAIEKTDGGPR